MALEVTFVRHRERRDRIYVTRPDGTSLSWDFPSYGDRLPHDLVHLVVEDGLGLARGFWGLVAEGVEVKLVDNRATLVRGGRPLAEQSGVDLTDLMKAEEAVAVVGDESGVTVPAGMSPGDVAATRDRLVELGRRWRELGDGDAITLRYAGTESSGTEEALAVSGSGQKQSKARRRHDVVLRQAGPWSGTTLALLRHLENVGFTGAPRVVGSGFADDGREMVSFVPGESPQPHAWSDEAVAEVGRLLRRLHEAASGFVPPSPAIWQPWFGRDLPGSEPVISHCDLGPWNIIARQGRPVAFVDWEFAGPVDAQWDLAHTAWLNAQLHDDDVAERHGLGTAEARAGQLRLLLDGYGLPGRRRPDLVDKMIALAIHSARHEAVLGRVTPESDAVDESGYPVLWAVTWRARSASWMLHHRGLLERAIAH